MAIFDTYYLTLAVLGLAVFFGAKKFLGALLSHEVGQATAPPAEEVPTVAGPSESQRFISARTRIFNLPRAELARLAVVVPKPLLIFGELNMSSQETLQDAYKEGHSRGPEATAFLFGEPLSEKNALYIAWFKDYSLPHFFVDKHVRLA